MELTSWRRIPPAPTENTRYHEFSGKGSRIHRKREIPPAHCTWTASQASNRIPQQSTGPFRPRRSIRKSGRRQLELGGGIAPDQAQSLAKSTPESNEILPTQKQKGDVRTTEPRSSVSPAATGGPDPAPREAAPPRAGVALAERAKGGGGGGVPERRWGDWWGVRIRYLARPWWPCRGWRWPRRRAPRGWTWRRARTRSSAWAPAPRTASRSPCRAPPPAPPRRRRPPQPPAAAAAAAGGPCRHRPPPLAGRWLAGWARVCARGLAGWLVASGRRRGEGKEGRKGGDGDGAGD
jgi:hypothetical protein